MHPNSSIVFFIPELRVKDSSDLPHGELLSFAVNPFTGGAVLSFQNNDKALAALDAFFKFYQSQLFELSIVEADECGFIDFAHFVTAEDPLTRLGRFARCEKCHTEPLFDFETNTLSCDCRDSEAMQFVSIEQALEVWNLNHGKAA